MTKCSVFIATSLDGFISRPDGSLDWLDEANAAIPEGEDCGYAKFISSVDALVMGRNTFEKVLSFGKWLYGSTSVFVLSRERTSLPGGLPETVKVTGEDPVKLVQRLSAEGLHHLYVDGGLTIQSFLAEDLIDEITITVIPILLGEGKSLFGPLSNDVHLDHVTSKAYEFGFVQSTYIVA